MPRWIGVTKLPNPAHSQAPARNTIAMIGSTATGDSSAISATTSAPSASAVSTRSRSGLDIANLRRRETEPPLPAGEVGDGLLEVVVTEVRPQRVAEEELRVGEVPEQEVADAMLAAGADE